MASNYGVRVARCWSNTIILSFSFVARLSSQILICNVATLSRHQGRKRSLVVELRNESLAVLRARCGWNLSPFVKRFIIFEMAKLEKIARHPRMGTSWTHFPPNYMIPYRNKEFHFLIFFLGLFSCSSPICICAWARNWPLLLLTRFLVTPTKLLHFCFCPCCPAHFHSHLHFFHLPSLVARILVNPRRRIKSIQGC